MMKTTTKLMLGALLSLGIASTAQAAAIDFSYTFVDGETVNGAITGTMVNYTMQNISDIQVTFDGNPLAGGAQLYLGSSQPDGSLVAGGAQFSQNFASNNFFISDQADPNSSSITEELSLFTLPDGSSTTFAYANLVTGSATGDTFFNDGSGTSSSFGPSFFQTNTGVDPQFSLTFVPEPGSLALGAIGLSALLLGRRRKS
jgi:hypothetical protein